MEKLFLIFKDKYYSKDYAINILISQTLLILFFLYKYNSRDFSFYAFTNDISLQPGDIYSSYVFLFAPNFLQNFFSLHFLHFFFGMPSEPIFFLLKKITNFFLIYILFFGFQYRLISFVTYFLLIYQWGFIFLTGQEVDSMMIFFGCFLVFSFLNPNVNAINFKKYNKKKQLFGILKSWLILIFVFYYFASGINKITDISILEWFISDTSELIKRFYFQSRFTSIFIFDFFKLIFENKFISYLVDISPAIVYLSHLFIYKIFFNRKLIPFFHLFYFIFHLMVFGVGISFFGYMLVWFLIYSYVDIFNLIKKFKI